MRYSPIAGLGYLVVQTAKVDEWRSYATELLGLMPSKLPLPDGSYAFRMDDRMARVIIQPGEDSVAAVGWEVAGRREWEDLQECLDRAGVASVEITGPEAHRARRDQAVAGGGPFRVGRRVRFHADARCDRPLRVADGGSLRHR